MAKDSSSWQGESIIERCKSILKNWPNWKCVFTPRFCNRHWAREHNFVGYTLALLIPPEVSCDRSGTNICTPLDNCVVDDVTGNEN